MELWNSRQNKKQAKRRVDIAVDFQHGKSSDFGIATSVYCNHLFPVTYLKVFCVLNSLGLGKNSETAGELLPVSIHNSMLDGQGI